MVLTLCVIITTIAVVNTCNRVQSGITALNHVIDGTPKILTDVVHKEMDSTRDWASAELTNTRAFVGNELRSTRYLIASELGATRTSLVSAAPVIAASLGRSATADLNVTLDKNLSKVSDAVSSQVIRLGDGSEVLIHNYANLPDRVSYATRWAWDCKSYAGCLPSQTLGLIGSGRYISGQVARSMPQFVSSAKEISASSVAISGNVQEITKNIKQATKPLPQPWNSILKVASTASTVAVPFLIPR